MKMISQILLVIIVVIFLVCLSLYSAPTSLSPAPKNNLLSFVCINGNCFSVELAKTSAERENGLMNRSEMGKNKGMFFIFDKEGIYPFWMKNTLIPLDIIWINSENKIVYLSQNFQPCKSLVCPIVIPLAKAKYVLEINGGIAKDLGIKLGDEVKINIQ